MSRPRVRRYGSGPRARRIHLVAPRHPDNFWSLQGLVDLFGARTLMPNPALATLMALTPPDVTVEYILGDENVAPLDLDRPCDLVALTGSTLHARGIHRIAAACRARGVPVALGGSYATLEEDACAGRADHHFVGEAEHTWPRFLREWTAGRAQPVYRQEGFVDLADSPAPDWSLIDADDYVNLPVQTSRGCPNRCDFCEVIQYLGRAYRTKPVEHILAEVRNAHAAGARSVFFSDDNFLGRRAFTRELLQALLAWNVRQTRPLSFSTQITVQVADDEDLLRLFADARFSVLFLGVESPRQECLDEVHKGQNVQRDLVGRIAAISRFGIVPFLGMIVGFDHDDATVFTEIEAFLERTGSPVAGISLLNAPRRTPLYERLQAEGRLSGEGYSGEHQLQTNIVPARMDRDELVRGYWSLFGRIYEPARFEGRLQRWLAGVEYTSSRYTRRQTDPKQLRNAARVFWYAAVQAPASLRGFFFRNLVATWRRDPRQLKRFFTLFAQYRHFHDFVGRPLPVAPGRPA